MRQAYLLIIFGILFVRFNFYLAFTGIDLLPDFAGYLLLFLASKKLKSYHKNPALESAGILCLIFLFNELIKIFYYPWLASYAYAAFVISLLLMAAQIALYVKLLKGCYLTHPFSAYHSCRWIYLTLASICVLIYIYLCFFGGYLYLMNLASLVETCYLLGLFAWVGRKSLHL